MIFGRCFRFSLGRASVIPTHSQTPLSTQNPSNIGTSLVADQVTNYSVYGPAERKIFQRLSCVTLDSAPPLFTMNGRELWCKVISVYDGDTVNIVFEDSSNANSLRHSRFRLYGIDCPEMKPLKNAHNRDGIIKAAISARDFLAEKVENKIVFIRFRSEEKYGRLMGDIFLTNNPYERSINTMMIDEGHAVPFRNS